MSKVLLDTNIVVSGLFRSGLPSKLLHKARKGEIKAVSSSGLLAELSEVLTRESKPFRLTQDEADKVIDHVCSWCEIVSVGALPNVCRDRDDNLVLATAEAGKVDYVITGDSDLLELGIYRGVRLVKVSTFFSELGDREAWEEAIP
ncbi:MAG: putative toxin-antitoxin system toxin component, PIN family [Armatimonadetes bacterium CG2_30_59_28]|nr:MAG: putative toxin-antitoxin system toxin component, PIN family [Armatimonadetes bacterium CG2_30_59_28]PIU62680.1 MAG: putative toxin-antitoxin system toxin component, PIN family [Armatimonadetes bacterium CG07_land_8_20_14_0_80_59_28]PIX46003.1 MAG: putative toxin-antitoxin system toxin component, PIN family [Armatimonadetes bacterium CG_4_8_14_3_um_filter_58_9]PIY41958.1 MAG: putative toxin-antitoxin system toxin component, PIN family [Armatimonadetes bacterium CG_4_10_14_3_um_filter_59_1